MNFYLSKEIFYSFIYLVNLFYVPSSQQRICSQTIYSFNTFIKLLIHPILITTQKTKLSFFYQLGKINECNIFLLILKY